MNIQYLIKIQNEDYPDIEYSIKQLERFIDLYHNDGNPDFKVSVKEVKPIDKDKLDELAKQYASKEDNYTEMCAGCEISSEYCDDKDYVEKAYKAGYKKAMEE